MTNTPDLPPDHPLALLTPAPPDQRWVVLHTRPRCEKKLVHHARLRPCRTYLPTTRRAHNYGRRVREYDVPLINGYVFACVQNEDLTWFRNNPYVANLLEVPDEAQFLAPLRAMADALSRGLDMEVLPYLKPGKTIVIIGGPMKGLEAVIAEVKGKNKVILQLELIRQSVALEIDTAWIKSAD
jgi:transcription antitermination factor NusG